MNKVIALFVSICTTTVFANDLYYSEDWHVRNWCNTTSTVEAVQDDKTRVDCLTKDFAYEFDWAKKYNEAIGQSLGYSIRTNRRP